jgi:drug/metabolite transporter (DMT)-like permease
MSHARRDPSPPSALPGHLAALFCFSAGPVGVVVQTLLAARFTPFAIIAAQMTLGGLALWGVSLAVDRGASPRAASAKALLLGVLHPGAFMLLNVAAAARLDGVTTVLLLAVIPAATAVLARLALGERLRPPVVAGLAVSLAGLAVLAAEREAGGRSEPLGHLLALAAVACAASGVVAGRALNTADALPWHRVAAFQVTGGATAAWLGGLLFGFGADLRAAAALWPAFAYLALVMTAGSYLAYNFALSRIEVPRLSLYIAAGPAVGALAAVVLLGERLGPAGLAGVAVVLAGALLPLLAGPAERAKGGTALRAPPRGGGRPSARPRPRRGRPPRTRAPGGRRPRRGWASRR